MESSPYQLLPALSVEDYATLRDDIAANGVQVAVLVDEHGTVIDGHHRVRIATELGIEYRTETASGLDDAGKRATALRLNLHRRQLTREQRAELHGHLRSEGMSLRQIAEVTRVDPVTVKNDLARVENSTPERVTGSDGRSYPATKPAAPPEPARVPDRQIVMPPEPEPILEPAHEAPTPEADLSEYEEHLLSLMNSGFTVVVSFREHRDLINYLGPNRVVRVDRNSSWGNPFVMPVDGDRGAVIAAYRDHYLPHKPSLLGRLDELRGKALACWCAPEPCHADVLLGALEES